MTEHRDRMMAALNSRFVPALRERGFVGSFPHFRRRSAERLDLLNVQFYSAGGSFTINIARTGPDGFVAGPWAHLAVEEIDVWHVGSDRRRITPRDAGHRGRGMSAEFWEFGPRSYDDPRPAEPQSFYDAIAEEVLATFLRLGGPWFERPEPPERGDEKGGPPGGWQPGDPWRFSRLLWHMRLRRPRMRIGVAIGGLEPELWRWENWRKIVPVMDSLVALLPRPVSILSGQMYEDGTGKQLPFGRMPWGEAGNRKWTTKYIEGPQPVYFSQTEFWSPSRSEWAEKGGAPDFYARLDHDPYGEVQGFILALRRDVLRMEGVAEAADRALDAVAEALPGSRTVINDRGWAEHNIGPVEIDPLDHTASELVFRFGEKRPWSRVEGFGAR